MITPYARANADSACHGFRVVSLENELLRLDVLPELGGKLFHFVHKRTDTDVLWHHPQLMPRPVSVGSSYDDNFFGGWDDLFPNDAPGLVEGELLPDHGELWCQPWEYRVIDGGSDEASAYFRCRGTVTPTTVEKWITIRPGSQSASIRYRITNHGTKTRSFLWKLHPALVIDDGDRVDVPGAMGELVDPAFGSISEPWQFPWPVAAPCGAQPIDFSVIPPSNGQRDFLYVRDLSAGWCALRRLKLGIGFGVVFPKDVFSSVWLFMTHGGWRGLRTLVLEPCTAYPKDLRAAMRYGVCSRLGSGAVLECEVRAVLFEGIEPIQRIDIDGTVVR